MKPKERERYEVFFYYKKRPKYIPMKPEEYEKNMRTLQRYKTPKRYALTSRPYKLCKKCMPAKHTCTNPNYNENLFACIWLSQACYKA
jgi:hypothetical protein